MAARDVVCPLEECKAAVDEDCKVLDSGHKMTGRYHNDRIKESSRITRVQNQELRRNMRALGKALRSQ